MGLLPDSNFVPGSHRLFVEYYRDNDNSNSSVPLVLDSFVVQNRTIPSIPLNSAGGAIAGLVIGSVVGLALIMFILIRFIKWPEKATEPEFVYHARFTNTDPTHCQSPASDRVWTLNLDQVSFLNSDGSHGPGMNSVYYLGANHHRNL